MNTTQDRNVLFGRGKEKYDHVGNIKFRKFICLQEVSEFIVEWIVCSCHISSKKSMYFLKLRRNVCQVENR